MNKDQNKSADLNKYIFQNRVGKGAFGKVYCTKEKETG